jgi:signal transduction histidine kinase
VVPESKTTAFSAAYERALREKVPVLVEDYFEPWDRWFEARVFPLQNGISVYTRDVTDKKKADQLRERLARYALLRAEVSAALAERREVDTMLRACCQAFVDQLGVAFARIWLLNETADTLILHASAGLYTHTNGAHGAVPVGKFKIGLIAAERQPHLSNDVQHDPRVGNPEWAKKEGMASFAGYPLLVDGRLLGVLAMFGRTPLADDTLAALGATSDLVAQGIARRLTEEELDQRVQELGRSNAELEQFAYVASHDLQEPLRVVASYNQLIARRYAGKLDKDADEFIAFTVDGVKRMQGLINDLLAYSRVGRRGGEFRELDLNQVFELARQNLEHAIADEGATIECGPLPKVLGDEGQMVQLLQNLLSNAIKFHGDEAPRIRVSAELHGKNQVITVEDNGIGIEPQYFERIFVIFQRLHPREKYPGTGIGLAVCKKIVERHGGKIWAETPPNRGSRIRFSLPLPAATSKSSKS